MSEKHVTIEELDRTAAEILRSIGGKELKAKDRTAIPQQDMPCQRADVRRSNMNEVSLGYTENQVLAESARCLQCKNAPCVKGCPVAIDIPAFIQKTVDKDFQGAYEIIRESSVLPAICGRVCPQEKQCMLECTVGKVMKDPEKAVAIGRIERYLADHAKPLARKEAAPSANRGKIAIIGSGPSGLTCAADLVKWGYTVTIFEAFHKPGGVTVYGIPEFRLPKAIVELEVKNLQDAGVTIITDYLVGRTKTIDQLMDDDKFEAVYVSTGAGLPHFLHIPGENLVGVFSANEYLTRSNLMKAYDKSKAVTPLFRSKKVAVFGGGNVAMDAARSALRIGAEEVHIVYRRTEKELPARVEEVAHAKEEGVIFDLLTNPVRIIGDEKNHVKAVECLRYKLGEVDESGRARPVAIEGSEFQFEADTCIIAIGNGSNPLIEQTTKGLDFNRKGNIIVDDNGMTSRPGVFAGGDIVQGAATVILAMGDGRKAAKGIHDYLTKK